MDEVPTSAYSALPYQAQQPGLGVGTLESVGWSESYPHLEKARNWAVKRLMEYSPVVTKEGLVFAGPRLRVARADIIIAISSNDNDDRVIKLIDEPELHSLWIAAHGSNIRHITNKLGVWNNHDAVVEVLSFSRASGTTFGEGPEFRVDVRGVVELLQAGPRVGGRAGVVLFRRATPGGRRRMRLPINKTSTTWKFDQCAFRRDGKHECHTLSRKGRSVQGSKTTTAPEYLRRM
ncbi:hypothetical protein BU15DRAFT_67757 [Melanogaster broomeanus]|nr:hypothetical protein BU15DRAFT_67757 [Melanogaster broomeanus]